MTEGSQGGGAFREVMLAMAEDSRWAAEVSEHVRSAVTSHIPDLAMDDGLSRAMLASNMASVSLAIRLLRDSIPPETAEPPPDAVALAQELVRRGVGVDVLLRGYHASEAAFFADFTRRVRANPDLAPDVATVIEEAALWLFALVGALTRGIVEQYNAESERWIRSAAASRLRDVRRVLSGQERLDAQAISTRLRYALDRRHLAIVVWTDSEATEGESAQAVLERTAAELARALGASSSLVVALEDQTVAAWFAGLEPDADRVSQVRLDPSTVPRVSAACGLPGVDVAGFRSSHEQAQEARRVARLGGRWASGIVDYREMALTAIATADPEQAREFVIRELGQLTEDSDEARRLAATLRIYLDESSSARRAATRLGVHENTIKNRIRAAEEQIGHPATERVAELLVALRLAALARPPEN